MRTGAAHAFVGSGPHAGNTMKSGDTFDRGCYCPLKKFLGLLRQLAHTFE